MTDLVGRINKIQSKLTDLQKAFGRYVSHDQLKIQFEKFKQLIEKMHHYQAPSIIQNQIDCSIDRGSLQTGNEPRISLISLNQKYQPRTSSFAEGVIDDLGNDFLTNQMNIDEKPPNIYFQEISKIQKKLNSYMIQTNNKIANLSNSLLISKNGNSQFQLQDTQHGASIDNFWVNVQSKNYGGLNINKNEITAINDQVQFLSTQKIKQKNQFTVNLNEINSGIWLGVVDASYISNRMLNYQPNWIFKSSSGWCQIGGRALKIAKGQFKNGDKVQVIVKIKQKVVIWKVNSQIQQQQTFQPLKDQSIQWVPYVRFYDSGSKITIIQ